MPGDLPISAGSHEQHASGEVGETLKLQPDGQWPLWHGTSSEDGASPEDGYGHIAAYVTPTPVDHFFPPGYRQSLQRNYFDDHDTVRELWQALVDKNLRYAEPPWNPAEGQRIRDPEWLLRRTDQGAGTCIDLSLLFAAQCLNEELDTYLVMLSGQKSGHVMVAVWLGKTAAQTKDDAEAKDESQVPPGTKRTDSPGVLIIDNREALTEEQEILLLDVVAATAEEPDRSLDAAIASAHRSLLNTTFEQGHLVDVAVRQEAHGDRPLEPPHSRGALRARIAPPPAGRARDFGAHKAARSTLQARTGKIIVNGPQGVGKSTLARKVAVAYDGGYGWFLNASSRVAFDTALAEHELFENGEPVRELEAADREAKARDALERLRRTEDRWIIVIDNANAGARDFDAARYAVDRLPVPKDGQLIIATSTADAEQWPGWSQAPLPTVPYEQLKALGDPQAARLSAGRPLLWDAFSSLFTFARTARELLAASHNPGGDSPGAPQDAASAVNDESARRATALHWSVARRHLDPTAVRCAERMAWLPPDRIEPGRAGDDEVIRNALTRAGLLTSSASPGAGTMHRLFGEAIRAAVATEGRAEATVRDLLARPAAQTSLLRYGDAEVTAEQATALANTDSGLALWALATLQEPYGGKASTETFKRARGLLDPPGSQGEKSALADCLHASARVANQKGNAPKEDIDAGIADARRAIELRDPAELTAIAKHEAILALLRQRAVKFIDDPAEKVQELHSVLRLLQQSWARRLAALGPDDPLVDRGYYNLAGVQVSLAKLDKANAGRLMAGVKEVYETTLAFRRRYYNGSNPITAASINGIGIWGLESIKLGVADDPDAVLAEAIDAVTEALGMRRESGIANDIEKSATLLAKLAVLQVKITTGTPGKPDGNAAATVAEAVGDLGLRAAVSEALASTA
jgi:hypothetical protein